GVCVEATARNQGIPKAYWGPRCTGEEAGLSAFVEIREGDALETLRESDGPIDLLLNDGFPMLALDIVKLLAPRMRPGAGVITDNVRTFPGNYADYMTYMRSPESGFRTTLLPYKSGTGFSVRCAGEGA
ncbi:MAG: hypothetical protein MI824_19240, partial [Hyphomicrobiales bacterium]|nr:hypothetical protein [Hyphomicrobiales bacterium]